MSADFKSTLAIVEASAKKRGRSLEEEITAENIPRSIVEPATDAEMHELQRESARILAQSESLLPPSPKDMEIAQAQRGEIVWTNEIEFLSATDMISEEERTRRLKAAFVNLSDCLIRQGKLEEAAQIAWDGLRYDAETRPFLQKAQEYIVALNTPDDSWCGCPDVEITGEDSTVAQVFGGKPGANQQALDVVKSLQVVDEIPSYRHGGKTVAIVRCNNCTRLNAVPYETLPNRVFDVVGKLHHPQMEQQRGRSDGSTTKKNDNS